MSPDGRSVPALGRTSRPGFVRHQVGLALDALIVGGVGAACAALRTLEPSDFGEPERAAMLLAVIRDLRATHDERGQSAMQLVALARAESPQARLRKPSTKTATRKSS